jgi:CheY-like chemotaxis protein
VLVVDDQVASDRLFSDAFGNRLTICTTVRDLEEHLHGDATWDVAFVDFLMMGASVDHRTGLSVLRALRAASPATKIVSYTQIPESGRRLFIAAAKQWFAAEAALDKTGLTVESIIRFVQALQDGHDPTEPRVTRWLAYADVVDRLLKEERYITLWRRWHELSGNKTAIEQTEYLSKAQLRTFETNAYDAVLEFKKRFEGVELRELESGVNKNYKGVLNSFASENRLFFAARDLKDALSARPRPRRK